MTSDSLAQRVAAEVLRRKPMHRRFLTQSLALLTSDEAAEADRYVEFMLAEGESIESLASAYLVMVDDQFRETMHFRQSGCYRFSSFEQARMDVYDNAPFMHQYMLGLALSTFWWANHVRLRRFFSAQLPALRARGGLYREVGPGHGIFFAQAMAAGGFSAYEAIDVSATSIALTRRMLNGGLRDGVPEARFVHADFLRSEPLGLARLLVMGEVLEHVEDPAAFLARAYATTEPDARVFLTTCLNAPAIDHLWNPPSLQALEHLFAAHGFSIAERCELGPPGLSLAECEAQRLTLNVGYVLHKETSA